MVSTGYIKKMDELRATAAAARCRLDSIMVRLKVWSGPFLAATATVGFAVLADA
jgi:hypothetical protein